MTTKIWTDNVRFIECNENKTLYQFKIIGVEKPIAEIRIGAGFLPKHLEIILRDLTPEANQDNKVPNTNQNKVLNVNQNNKVPNVNPNTNKNQK
jgi:hypothetical protein